MGAEVLGGPGLMPEYEPGHYACYVRDPDGNNIEAVARRTRDREEQPSGAPGRLPANR